MHCSPKEYPPQEIGEEIDDYIRLERYQTEIKGKTIHTEVIHVDGFGNCITNVTYSTIEKLGVRDESQFEVELDNTTIKLPYVTRFSYMPEGEPLLLVAGGGYLEIAVNQGNAQKKFGLKKGDKISLKLL